MSTNASRGFWPMRDLPVVVWLLIALVVALAHPLVPAPRWLLIHLLLLGAATHAILVWSRYFTDALLRSDPNATDRPRQNRRLVLLTIGVVLVLVGVITDTWPLTVVGATAVAAAVIWHGLELLLRLRAALPGRFRITVRYYLAAATLLPVGLIIGVVLARVQADPWHERLLVAHASLNLLGWIGLTALGTLVTLWPTLLRTRISPDAEKSAVRALPVLLLAVLLVSTGPLLDLRVVAGSGYAVYLVGICLLAPAWVTAARARKPTTFPTLSVGAALLWLTGCLLALSVLLTFASSWSDFDDRFRWFTPFLAVGFGAQLLLGATSYLVPVALGGGPSPVRTANEVLNRAAVLRVTATNLALLVCLMPVPAAVRVVSSVVVLGSLGAFLPLLVLALRASRAVRSGKREAVPANEIQAGSLRRQALGGLAIALVAAAVGVGLDQASLAAFTDEPVAASAVAAGHTTVVKVRAYDMRFHPDSVEVPAGDRLMIEVSNTDTQDVHDLVLDDGTDTGRLSPGDSIRLDLGVVGRNVAGWCSVVGHRQIGMTFSVVAVGADPSSPDASSAPEDESMHHGSAPDMAAMPGIDLGDRPGPLFVPRSPALPSLLPGRVHRRTIHVRTNCARWPQASPNDCGPLTAPPPARHCTARWATGS